MALDAFAVGAEAGFNDNAHETEYLVGSGCDLASYQVSFFGYCGHTTNGGGSSGGRPTAPLIGKSSA